jgi:hypothetical protein
MIQNGAAVQSLRPIFSDFLTRNTGVNALQPYPAVAIAELLIERLARLSGVAVLLGLFGGMAL